MSEGLRQRTLAAKASNPHLLKQRIERTTSPSIDHAGRPALSFWYGPVRPGFSFQVYTTVDLDEDGFKDRFPQELFPDRGERYRVDVYEQQKDVFACMTHQRYERNYRVQHPESGPISKEYRLGTSDDDMMIAGCFIIVIDILGWNGEAGVIQPGLLGPPRGPLYVRFDVRPHERRVFNVVNTRQDLVEGEDPVFEQLELRIERRHRMQGYANDLQIEIGPSDSTWIGPDVTEEVSVNQTGDEVSQQTLEHTTSMVLTRPHELRPQQQYDLFYRVYLLAPITDMATTAQAFFDRLLTHLDDNISVHVEMFGLLPNIATVLAHNETHMLKNQSIGYLGKNNIKPWLRRFPEHYAFPSIGYPRRLRPTHRHFWLCLIRSILILRIVFRFCGIRL